jgi:hypothetical protein
MGLPNCLLLRATPGIVGWYARRTWNNSSNWYTYQSKLLSNWYSTYRICKCGRGPRNTTWRSAGWRPTFETKLLKFGEIWGSNKSAGEDSCHLGHDVVQTDMYTFQCFGDVFCLHAQGSPRMYNDMGSIPDSSTISTWVWLTTDTELWVLQKFTMI